MTTHEAQVAAALAEALRQHIGVPRFSLWFENKTKFTWNEDQLVVGVPNLFYQDWLQKTFGDSVAQVARQVLDKDLTVRFIIDPELFQATRREQHTQAPLAALAATPGVPTATAVPLETPERPVLQAQTARAQPRRWRLLEDFVVGSCNRVAHASALSVAEAPAQDANPLVLHGPVGTGKTHLLEGIYAGLKHAQPSWRITFATAEEFTHRFVHSMRLGKLSGFRKCFRETDVLLVDDLHFLSSKAATQEEFVHTLDALLRQDRQVVVSCDCHPRLADVFVPELADRLVGGAAWGLMLPDRDTRLDMLRAKAVRLSRDPIAEDVLIYLADHLRGNVRELEGALCSVQHLARVAGRRVDLALAREAVADLLRHAVRLFQPADIERAASGVLRLDAGTLKSRGRSWAHAHPRMLAMFLARKHTAATYTEIGRHFGGRNHSTAVAAEKKVRQWLVDNAPLHLGDRQVPIRDLVEQIERELLR